jgi:hypothetical protein
MRFSEGDRETSSRNFQRVAKNGGLDIVEGSAPSLAKKEDAHGTPTTPGVMAHCRKERKIKPSGDGDASRFPGTLAVSRSGRAGLSDEAVLAVREQPPRREKRTTCRKTLKAHPPERKERSYTIRLFGTNSLKEGGMSHVCNVLINKFPRRPILRRVL